MTNYHLIDLLRQFRHRVLRACLHTWLLGGFVGFCFALTMMSKPAFSAENTGNACVLLKNDNVLFGTAFQVGEYVVIRRGDQSELRMPRTSVACWAGSPRDLYRYRIDHRETEGFDTHIKEADWCLQNDLVDLAEIELQFAKEIMPVSQAVARLEERIRRINSPISASVPLVENVMPVAHEEESIAPNAFDPQTIGNFARNVQVTLINRCGNCHAADTDRAWTIASPPGKARASAEMTSENLLATLPFIDSAQPLNSLLLTKALTAHGGAAAPLGPRHAKAVYSLRRWLLQAGQSLRTQAASQPSSATEFVSEESAESYLTAKQPESQEELPDEQVGNATVPHRMPEVEDPFDPDLFNRQFHR